MAARQQKSRATIDHEEIRRWVESMRAYPARVKGTGRGDDPGILRIDFPRGVGEEKLEHISWDAWSKWFDKNKLAFLYDPGIPFAKLVSRDTVAERLGRGATTGRAAGAKRATGERGGARTAARGRAKKAESRKTTARRTRAARPDGAATKRTGAKRTTAKRGATTRRPAKRAGAPRAASRAKRTRAKTPTRGQRGSKRASRR
jgi:hypothetical protein